MIEIPKIIREECPLPNGYTWEDANSRNYAGIYRERTKCVSHYLEDAGTDTDDSEEMFNTPRDVSTGKNITCIGEFPTLEDAFRFIYAHFIMGGTT